MYLTSIDAEKPILGVIFSPPEQGNVAAEEEAEIEADQTTPNPSYSGGEKVTNNPLKSALSA